LIAVLVQVIEQGSTTEKLRGLQAFQQVIRALASKRLVRHRQEFQQVEWLPLVSHGVPMYTVFNSVYIQIGPQLFVLTAQLWTTNVESLLNALSNYNAKSIPAQASLAIALEGP